jgi:hypothetical protein
MFWGLLYKTELINTAQANIPFDVKWNEIFLAM